jgi:ABC-type polysaccharide/polyol phosphate transport system ATPase subunit
MSDMAAEFPIVEFEKVSKAFDVSEGRTFLRTYLAARLKRKPPRLFHALRNVSFAIEHGESMAIIGPNGAGKSTLLSLVAGVNFPTEGRVSINGSVAALLELGSGFHPDLTGRENVHLNGALLGFGRKQVLERFDSIVEFSGTGAFIDQPLRTYSSGMTMRLAFSVAINVDPDILVIDEAFAVGDLEFQEKCVDRIFAFKQARKTFVCVSHSFEILRKLCEHALWLEHGSIIMTGKTDEVINAYKSARHSHAGV